MRALTRLKQSPSRRRTFIEFVRRHGFMREDERIYVVITALLETLRAATGETDNEPLKESALKDVASIEEISKRGETKLLGQKSLPEVKSTEARLRAAWERLDHTLSFDDEDKKELAPVIEILEPIVALRFL